MHKYLIYRLTFLLFLWLAAFSCKPVIYSFNVTPLTITSSDTVRMNWSVRGKPTLITHTDSTDQPGYELRQYSLVAELRGKQTERTAVVNVLPALSFDIISFDCIRKGDTLIAAGEKNNRRWGDHFTVQGAGSFSGRPLLVTHSGRSAALTADSIMSSAFAGLPNNGYWEFKTLLTTAEKKDTGRIPGILQMQTILLFKK